MSRIEPFLAYATDFEKTYVDDDWSRLEKYFADDAVYEVRNVSFACKVEGPKKILAAIRKSVDGFDRRMDERKIELTRGPVVSEDEVEIDWRVHYSKAGAPDFTLVGGTVARLRDGKIVHMFDRYPDGVDEEAGAWIRAHAPDIDPSYV